MLTTHPPSETTALRSPTRRDMIEACGRLAQMFGLPRSIGQIYGLLFLSAAPLTLDDIVQLLSMSKGSASTGTRQLMSWGAIRQIWVQGDRRDYFEAVPDIIYIIRAGYTDFLKPRLNASGRRLDGMTSSLDAELAQGLLTEEEHKICLERLNGLSKVQKKLQAFVPFADQLM